MAKIKQHIVMANVGGSKREEGGLASEEVGECSSKEIQERDHGQALQTIAALSNTAFKYLPN